HHLMGLQMLVMQPNTRQTLKPLRIVIFGDQFGAFPHPAYLVEPAPHRFRSPRDPMFGLERRGERGTTPPGAAPAIDTWGFFEYGPQRAREPRHEDGRLHSDGELTVCMDEYDQ